MTQFYIDNMPVVETQPCNDPMPMLDAGYRCAPMPMIAGPTFMRVRDKPDAPFFDISMLDYNAQR